MDKNTQPDGTRTVSSVRTACQILEKMYESGGAGVTELADKLDLSKGAVHHQLTTLRQEGFVVKRGTQYQPSLRFLDIGQGVKHQATVFEAARPEVRKLAEKSGENAHLMVEQNGWGYNIILEQGENTPPTTSRPGKRLHLHYTSTGKAILAYLPESRVERIVEQRGLPKRTEKTITDPERLFEELAEIRERDISFDTGEQIAHARCVGAPIRDPNGDVLGAISVSGPQSRMKGDRFQSELPEMVSEAADVIEMNIEMDEFEDRFL